MITANELRIGNIVDYFSESADTWLNAHCITANDILCLVDGTVDRAEPIPLTEEWLLRFGFKKHKAGIGGADMWQGMDGWSIDESVWLFRGNPKRELKLTGYWNSNIQYVHQLQNIFHSLFQTELTLTNP